MSDLLQTASRKVVEEERNAARFRAWRYRYFSLFGRMPDGDIRQHRRTCIIEQVLKARSEAQAMLAAADAS